MRPKRAPAPTAATYAHLAELAVVRQEDAPHDVDQSAEVPPAALVHPSTLVIHSFLNLVSWLGHQPLKKKKKLLEELADQVKRASETGLLDCQNDDLNIRIVMA
eukprot:scaffold24536_cov56-Skeletonema_dohrnii-CCMP3373.AAC.1